MESILEKNGVFKEEIKNLFFISSLKKDSTAISILNSIKRKKNIKLYIFSDIEIENDNIILINDFFDINKYSQDNNIKVDILFFIEGGTMKIFPMGINKMSSINIWYGIDTHMDYKKHLYISRLFDLTFIAQYEFVERLIRDGIKNCIWLPLAFDSYKNKNLLNKQKKFDISYVGSLNANLHKERIDFLNLIKNNFKNTYIGPLESEKMYLLYSNSKIVFNKSINNDINMRIFEAMGCGALLFTNRINNNGIEKLFNEDKHYIVYNNETDLIYKLNYYLNNEYERNIISNCGKKEILNLHTYDNRVNEILFYINNYNKSVIIDDIDFLPVYNKLNLYRPFNYVQLKINSISDTNNFIKFYRKIIYLIIYLLDSFLIKIKFYIEKV